MCSDCADGVVAATKEVGMPDRDEIHAAVGALVIQATWLEYLAARLVARAGRVQNEMELLKSRKSLFREARNVAATLPDADLAAGTRDWLDKAQALLDRRDEVVHAIVIHEHEPGWNAYHPRSGRLLKMSPKQIADLARQLQEHADDGTYSSIFEWARSPGRE